MNLEKTFDDLTLVSLVKEGNHLAFQEIYRRYFDALFGYAYNLVQRREAAEEILQDIFVALWAKRDTISVAISLGGYLHSMVKHAALNHMRSEHVRAQYAAQHAAFLRHRADNSNVEYQDMADLERAIEAGVADLNERERTAFRLSRQEHLNLDEVAKRMNLSKGTIENYLVKALRHLRNVLKR